MLNVLADFTLPLPFTRVGLTPGSLALIGQLPTAHNLCRPALNPADPLLLIIKPE